jgi:hypothetical protein
MSLSVVFSSANNSKLACTKLQAGAQSVHENICRHRARARILRIGICRSEQKRRCATNTADGLSKDHKNLLHKDHRFWHSSAMRTVVRDDVSDHGQPDRGFRARINNLAKKIGVRRAVTLPDTAAANCFLFSFANPSGCAGVRRLSRWDAFPLGAAAGRGAVRRFSFLG